MERPEKATTLPAPELPPLPLHRHADARPAAGVVVPDQLLDRTRIELPILRELERDEREAVGLTGGIEPEDVGGGLGLANVGIEHGREQEQERREDEREQRHPGRIVDAADAPAL